MSNFTQYLIILVMLFVLEFVYFKIADKYNIVDKPNLRSSHKRVTLRGGGVIFYLGILLYMFFYGFTYPYFFLGLTLICGISFADDIGSVTPKIRLFIHFIAILLMFCQWGIFIGHSWWYILIALILCAGIINAYNFMDGINGITGGYSLVILVTLGYVNGCILHFVDPSLIYVSLLAVLVFNFFNFRTNAKCFAGDVGSVGIAFIILFILGRLVLITENLYWIIFLAVYGVDSILTIIRRIVLHENIFLPHRKHAYQILANEKKISHVNVTLIYMSIQSFINILALYLEGETYRWLYWGILILALSVAYLTVIQKIKLKQI